MRTFWSNRLWKQILCFQHVNQFYFLLSLAGWIVLYFAIHRCLNWMQMVSNQKFSAILRKSEVNFLLEAILFLQRNGFHTLLVICVHANVCMLETTYDRKNRLRVLRSWNDLPGQISSWNRQDCNRQSMQRVQNTGWLDLDCVKILGQVSTVVFQTDVFLIPSSSDIDRKTSNYFSRICLGYFC